jgi:hypothetical protein
MVVGDKDYQLNLSRLAFSFKGAISMEYLQSVGIRRIQELTEHSKVIAEELKKDG